jgi:hypothetical protein
MIILFLVAGGQAPLYLIIVSCSTSVFLSYALFRRPFVGLPAEFRCYLGPSAHFHHLTSSQTIKIPSYPSSMERNDPPARRKSCQACKKARRRCDLARPTCQRCAQRNIHCHYPYAPPQRESAGVIVDAQPMVSVSDIELSYTPSCLGMLGSILETTDDFTDELFRGSLDCDASNWSTPRLSTTAQDALNRSQLVTVPQVTRAISSRLQYAMDTILKGPSQMVSENQTPWCHSHLYDDGMPRSMQRGFVPYIVDSRITLEYRCGIFCCTPCSQEPPQR